MNRPYPIPTEQGVEWRGRIWRIAGAQDTLVPDGGGSTDSGGSYPPDTPAPESGGGSANTIENAPPIEQTLGQADFPTATSGGGSRLASGSSSASKAAIKAAELQFQLGEENLQFQESKFGQEFPLEESQQTGQYQGSPTLSASQLIGQWQGQDTLAKGQLMGELNGQPTEAAKQFEQTFGLQIGELTGMYGGQPTEKANEFAQSLAWDKDKFAQTIELQKQDLEIKRGQLAVSYGEAYADAWYKQNEVALAREAHSLQAGQIGLDYLKTATQLHSQPRSWAELADFAAGAKQRQDVPVFMANLQNAVTNPAFQQYAGTTQPNSAENVTQELGGAGGQVLQSQWAEGSPLAGLSYAQSFLGGGGGGGGEGGGNPHNANPEDQGGPAEPFSGMPASVAAIQQQQGPPYGRAYGYRRKHRAPAPAPGDGGATTPPATTPPPAAQPPAANPWADVPHASMLDDLYHNQGWSFQDVSTLAAADRIGAAGAHQLGAGSLESLDQQDRDVLFGGLDRLGYSADRFARDYIRSRVAQGKPTQA